jgi:hypothetical protein
MQSDEADDVLSGSQDDDEDEELLSMDGSDDDYSRELYAMRDDEMLSQSNSSAADWHRRRQSSTSGISASNEAGGQLASSYEHVSRLEAGGTLRSPRDCKENTYDQWSTCLCIIVDDNIDRRSVLVHRRMMKAMATTKATTMQQHRQHCLQQRRASHPTRHRAPRHVDRAQPTTIC